MANDDFPSFTEEHFEEIGGSPEGKYIAFLFDPDNKAVGTLRGNNLINLTDHLKENALKTGYSYILLSVIEEFKNQRLH